jgi:hypothetical protein
MSLNGLFKDYWQFRSNLPKSINHGDGIFNKKFQATGKKPGGFMVDMRSWRGVLTNLAESLFR